MEKAKLAVHGGEEGQQGRGLISIFGKQNIIPPSAHASANTYHPFQRQDDQEGEGKDMEAMTLHTYTTATARGAAWQREREEGK